MAKKTPFHGWVDFHHKLDIPFVRFAFIMNEKSFEVAVVVAVPVFGVVFVVIVIILVSIVVVGQNRDRMVVPGYR